MWPTLRQAEPAGWQQLPRPANVRIIQCVDRAVSKAAVAVEGKDREKRARAAQRLYAAMLMKALAYGGADVGVITYKSTREWLEENCFVPDWLKLMHWGDLTGTNALEHVRALFVSGRPLASPEAVTRQAEALFGTHIAQREYVKRTKGGEIPIAPDAHGHNCVLVDVWEHPDPMAERLRRQITEGAILQAVGRARAGLRREDEPLDIHLLTDVPVPELGPVEPMLWDDLKIGLDGVMLAQCGVWLDCMADAARVCGELLTVRGLKDARSKEKSFSKLIAALPPAVIKHVKYRRAGPGCSTERAAFLRPFADPCGFLEKRRRRVSREMGRGRDSNGNRPPITFTVSTSHP
jgi:putative DNA primase/helicase